MQYRIKPSVVDEEMEGELLAIDDTTGKYFAVGGTGVWLWGLLRNGVDVTALCASLEPAVGADVTTFVSSLESAGLLVEADDRIGADLPVVPSPWSTPMFDVHDDLQDLLLLDPIHDVADEGWPNIGAAG